MAIFLTLVPCYSLASAADMVVVALEDAAGVAAPPAAPLETVIEDEELSTAPRARDVSRSVSVLVCDADDKAVSFHESATSKDVIDELNRMIRKGEGDAGEEEAVTPGCHPARPRPRTPALSSGEVAPPTGSGSGTAAMAGSVDGAALSCPTGWVHVERDIDFTDPKVSAFVDGDSAPAAATEWA